MRANMGEIAFNKRTQQAELILAGNLLVFGGSTMSFKSIFLLSIAVLLALVGIAAAVYIGTLAGNTSFMSTVDAKSWTPTMAIKQCADAYATIEFLATGTPLVSRSYFEGMCYEIATAGAFQTDTFKCITLDMIAGNLTPGPSRCIENPTEAP